MAIHIPRHDRLSSRAFIVACAAFAASSLVVPSSATAQDWPEGWQSRTDQAGADVSEIAFRTMTPGWHVTTGPATILYDPSNTASGAFRVEAETFLFDPRGRREAFGVIIGGKDLQGPDQAYVYFLIRPTGEYLIKRRAGSETADIVGWTANDAILSWADREEGDTPKNVLAVEAGPDRVRFSVNGVEMTTLPRADLDLDGIVGLRVNHMVDIHVSSLSVSPLS